MKRKEFDNIKELIYSGNQNNGEKDFKDFLSERLENLNNLLNDINVTDSIEKIKRIIDLEYQGVHSKAFVLFCELMETLPKNTTDIKKNTDFYRIRKCEFSERKRIAKNVHEMFHIPFTKRGVVKTQRYSISGLPCLYLGYSVYGCWEEMGRPHLDECMVSRFQNTKQIKVFDIRVPTKYDEFKKNENNYIRLFPLMASCMVQVKNPKDYYKPEYIIPQMLMEWILDKKKDCIGVFYTSVYVEEDNYIDNNYPEEYMHNIAIPAIYKNELQYSSYLCKLFKLTKPKCREFEAAKGRYETIKDFSIEYRASDYGFLEKRLKSKKVEEIKSK